MEPWRALMNAGKFEEARLELDQAERTISEQMEQSRLQLEEQMRQSEQELSAEFEKARAEIADAERAHREGSDGGGNGLASSDDGSENWRHLMDGGAFSDARRALDEAGRASRAERERMLRQFEDGAEKMRRKFEQAVRQIDVDHEKLRRDFDNHERELTAREQRARVEIDEAERAHRGS